MNCWKCGALLSDLSYGKIEFRATCEKCGIDLHCCQNCKYYKPGLPNDCVVPGTEYVSDRQKSNLCEEFALLGKGPSSIEKGDKQRFNDLFR